MPRHDETEKKPHSSRSVIKWLAVSCSVALAIIGVFIICLIGYFSLGSAKLDGNAKICYAGQETQGHSLLGMLPFTLPEQESAGMPVISDDRDMGESTPVLIFHASPEWITQFKSKYGLRVTDNAMSPYSNTTGHMEQIILQKPQVRDEMDACLWHPLQSDIRVNIGESGDKVIDLDEAFVDEAKGYVLLHLFIHGKSH